MNDVIRLDTAKERLENSLIQSIDCFKSGSDSFGIKAFLDFTEDLENLLNIYECIEEPKIIIDKILPEIQTLHTYLQNQDIVGVTDILEYTIYPMLIEMTGGNSEK